MRDLLVRILGNEHEVYSAEDCVHAEAILEAEAIDVIICDHGLPGESGLDFLSRIRMEFPYIQRILLAGHTDVELAIRAINEGRYLPKPAEFSTVCEAVNSGLEKRKKMLCEKQIVEEIAAMKERMNSLPYFMRRMRVLGLEGDVSWRAPWAPISLAPWASCSAGSVCSWLYLIKTVAGVNMLSLNLEELVGQFHDWATQLTRL